MAYRDVPRAWLLLLLLLLLVCACRRRGFWGRLLGRNGGRMSLREYLDMCLSWLQALILLCAWLQGSGHHKFLGKVTWE